MKLGNIRGKDSRTMTTIQYVSFQAVDNCYAAGFVYYIYVLYTFSVRGTKDSTYAYRSVGLIVERRPQLRNVHTDIHPSIYDSKHDNTYMDT